ncbi:MAG: sugar transferase [Muribaculaceae bacterium]|nr:sugar transferase [Muribaculaceae bacterium]
MLRRRNAKHRTAYLLSDFIMTSLAFFIFNILRFHIIHGGTTEELWNYLLSRKLLLEQAFIPVILMFTYFLSGFYNNPFPRSRISEFLITSLSAAANALLLFMTILINDPTPRRRTEYLIFGALFLLLFTFTLTGRIIISTVSLKRARRSSHEIRTVIIGNSERGYRAADMILSSKSVYRNRIAGIVAIEGEHTSPHTLDEVPMIPLENIKDFCRKERVSQIVLAPEIIGDRNVLQMVAEFIDLDIPIKIAPDDLDYAMAGIRTVDLLGYTLIDLTTPRISDFSRNMKRTFDILISVVSLIILSPALLGVALAVKLDSPGPVFYTQERMGRRRKPFRIIKFRSMRTDAEADGPRLSSDNDTRITKIGRFLRKYRIDELPQLFNVIRGDMSIVGPRPEREYYSRQIVERVPWYGLIYQVRPGITSWAMVKFGYASTLDQMVERTKFDLIYINNMSLLLDMKILFHTVRTVLTGAGI